MRRSVVLAALVVLASELGAQAELQGRVLAEGARRPIANAMVALPRLDIRTVTDSLGKYRLAKIPRGEQLVVTRAVGYRPDSTITVFDGDETIINDVVLKAAVNELPTVAVRESSTPVRRGKMAGFDERRALGIGRFIGRELLDKDENRRLAEILGSNVPGLSIYRGSGSKAWGASGRATGTGKCAMCRVTKSEIMDPSDAALGVSSSNERLAVSGLSEQSAKWQFKEMPAPAPGSGPLLDERPIRIGSSGNGE